MRRVVAVCLPTWATDRLRRNPGAPPPETAARHRGERRPAQGGRRRRPGGAGARHPPRHAARPCPRHGPGLAVRDADPADDAAALDRLAAWCLRYAPLVAADAPDGLWIDVSGPRTCSAARRRCWPTSSAASPRPACTPAPPSPTPPAPPTPAQFGREARTVIAPGAHPEAIAALPVAALRLPAEMVAALRRLGLERVGALAEAPRGPWCAGSGRCSPNASTRPPAASSSRSSRSRRANGGPSARLRRTAADRGSLRPRHRRAAGAGVQPAGGRRGGRAAPRSAVRARGRLGAGDPHRHRGALACARPSRAPARRTAGGGRSRARRGSDAVARARWPRRGAPPVRAGARRRCAAGGDLAALDRPPREPARRRQRLARRAGRERPPRTLRRRHPRRRAAAGRILAARPAPPACACSTRRSPSA